MTTEEFEMCKGGYECAICLEGKGARGQMNCCYDTE